MELVPYGDTPADEALTRALETNPDVMRELGGPIAGEEIGRIHSRRAATVAGGDWWMKIVPSETEGAVGAIGIWPHEWEGASDHEIGWMILPAHQGKGIASRAVEMILAEARDEPRFERIHAFPAITNPASNALCRKHGFELIGELDGGYAGRPLRCNHWLLRLRDYG